MNCWIVFGFLMLNIQTRSFCPISTKDSLLFERSYLRSRRGCYMFFAHCVPALCNCRHVILYVFVSLVVGSDFNFVCEVGSNNMEHSSLMKKPWTSRLLGDTFSIDLHAPWSDWLSHFQIHHLCKFEESVWRNRFLMWSLTPSNTFRSVGECGSVYKRSWY